MVTALVATVPAPPATANDTSPEPNAAIRAAPSVPVAMLLALVVSVVAEAASPDTSAAAMANTDLACAGVKSSGSPAAAVARPLIVAVATLESLALVTASLAIVVANAPATDVTSPVNAGARAAANVPEALAPPRSIDPPRLASVKFASATSMSISLLATSSVTLTFDEPVLSPRNSRVTPVFCLKVPTPPTLTFDAVFVSPPPPPAVNGIVTAPVLRLICSASFHVAPSGLTLKWKSSSPVVPISARPEKPV